MEASGGAGGYVTVESGHRAQRRLLRNGWHHEEISRRGPNGLPDRVIEEEGTILQPNNLPAEGPAEIAGAIPRIHCTRKNTQSRRSGYLFGNRGSSAGRLAS